MKGVISIVGIILIIFGIAVLGYQGFSYTKREKVMQIGSLEVTADKEKTVYFPPILGAMSLVAGIILVVISRKPS